MALDVGTATDPGRRREQNEDCFATWSDSGGPGARLGTLLVVADGMGGAAAGEVASRIAAETVVECYRASAGTPTREALHAALTEANRRVHAEALAHPEFRGMGTTCTAAVVRGREVTIGHVGDSRAYLVHGGTARALTRDHTLVARLVEDGLLDAEQARVDPRRNVVTRSIGVNDGIDVDAEHWGALLEPGCALVLCSDGLHGPVGDGDLARLVTEAAPAEACRALVALANERGGPDNITVIVARAGLDESRPARPPVALADLGVVEGPPPPSRGRGLPPLIVVAALAALLVLVVSLALRAAR
jgi:serine/threonine protein phosphatase PrpC